MKIKILNDGVYDGLDNVNFPIVVEAEKIPNNVYKVAYSEFDKFGCNLWEHGGLGYLIFLHTEIEL